MQKLEHFIVRAVSFLAIRSWRDFIWKTLAFLILLNVLLPPMEFLIYPPDARPDRLSTVLIVVCIATPFLAIQFIVVTYLDRLQRRLAELAMTDVLTGLPNRRAFIENTTTTRENLPVGTLLLLDADHFKRINDTYGHATGDACLQAIAERLRQSLTPDDVYGRLGGEEFAAYLPRATPQRVRQFGEQLTRSILTATADGKATVNVTLSIGAAYVQPECSIEVLFRRADTALYSAKANGRAKMVIWDEMEPPLQDAG